MQKANSFYMKLVTSNNMKKIILGLFVIAFSTFVSAGEFARPVGNGYWYYSVGGGDPLLYYHQSNKTTLKFGAGAEWNMFRSCSFDPSFAIRENFSNIKDNVYGLTNDVVDSAMTTFGAWGISKIRESYPGLYDTLTKGLKDAKETFQLSLKTCRDAQADIRSGRDPVDGWISVSRKSSWAKASASGSNPSEAERDIEENAGAEGITWVGGVKAGGDDQPPIRAVEDVTQAGYQHLVGSLTPADPDEVTGDPNITRVFSDANEASEWVVSVIGEREVRICPSPNCDRLKTRVGQGLRFQYRKEYEKVSTRLKEVLAQREPDNDDLKDLSAPGMGVVVNNQIIRSLQQAPREESSILAHKLAGEVALARTMEKALIVRDLMNAGSQEPNVTAAGEVAEREIDIARKRLQAEIDNVLFESEVRQKVITNAAGTIASRGNQRDQLNRGEKLKNNTINTPKPEMLNGGIAE
jgi:integrating conjugative element protein (TIGR03755 family)